MALRAGCLSKNEWKDHFITIGISEEDAKRYATTFYDHKMQIPLLKYLSDSDLEEKFFIATTGHRLAIKHMTTEPTAPPLPALQQAAHPRPQIRHQAP